ncbi:MAG: hypothetical protein ABI680_01450, partial [Chthoniobacteraceae bacterium]
MTQPAAPTAPVLHLRTPVFTCGFDRETGFLRRVEVGGVEILRAIYGAVRDQNWGTVPVALTDVRTTADDDSFDLRFTADCRAADAHFRWNGLVRGRDGELEFEFRGRALTSFLRNRIGLCVLHPLAEGVGKPCRIMTGEGRWEASAFPTSIAPRQPFKDVRAIAWEPADGIGAEVSFEGDVFETEDQRNWTDASFKTYSTPLERPFPVEIAAGTEVWQRVVVKMSEQPTFRSVAIPAVPEIRFVDGPAIEKPSLGLGLASHGEPLSPRAAGLLRTLKLSHLRVDLHLGDPRWIEEWERAQADAAAVGAALHCALHFGDDAELAAFVSAAQTPLAPIALCLVMNSGDEPMAIDRLTLVENGLAPLDLEIAVGTNANFADLNRARPPAGSLVAFSLNPQVHAFDDLSLVENLEAQPDTVTGAMAFGARGVVISPITLRPRLSPHDTGPVVTVAGELPANVDPRQRTLFGAAWTLGCLARLASLPAVHSLTFYETSGWLGLLERASGSPLPDLFGSKPGEVFPLFHVFADLADCDQVLPMHSSDPSKCVVLGLRTNGGQRRILVANLQAEPQTVRIHLEAAQANVRLLDEITVACAKADPTRFRASEGEPVTA